MKSTNAKLLIWLLLFCSAAAAEQRAPNIVLLLADDLGFTDLGSYGSEIHTPNLDRLAAEGLRFSNFHAGASCAPSRAMLLTGVDSHRAGVANIPEAMPRSQRGQPGYEGELSQRVRTIAESLQAAGYHTHMTGKWHLGSNKDTLPSARGFERTVALADSGADNWEQRPYLPMYRRANWFADGERYQLPEDFYSSIFLVDKAMEFIEDNRDSQRPFFSYIAFQAVHIPVQAPREFTEKYLGTYDSGWSALREQRLRGAQRMGVMPSEVDMVTMTTTPDWDSLNEEERRLRAGHMAVHAGMVDAMDYHIGRLMQYLQDIGEYDNTIFVFLSDNGAEPSDPATQFGLPMRLWLRLTGYHLDYDRLGARGSFVAIGPGFASAASSPLAYYKFFSGEGGLRVPLIIAGPGVDLPGAVSHALSYITDIVPTLLELAQTKPAEQDPEKAFEPVSGKSLTPLLSGLVEEVRGPGDAIVHELGGNAAVFKGDYKAVFNRGPVGDQQWRLFNIRQDPGETRDLTQAIPEKLRELLADYQHYVDHSGVLPVPARYDQRRQVAINSARARLPEILAGLLVMVAVVSLVLARARRKAV